MEINQNQHFDVLVLLCSKKSNELCLICNTISSNPAAD